MQDEDSDEDLMIRAGQGNAYAFDRLVRRHLARACAIAARVAARPADIEDIAQEAFTKAWVGAPSWKPGKSKFTTWFYRIVVNTAIDAVRRRKPQQDIDWDTLPDPEAGAETRLIERQQAESVERHLRRLPERQRVAVALCYLDDMTNREAAAIMGINLKSLEALLFRARQTLKQALVKEGWAQEREKAYGNG